MFKLVVAIALLAVAAANPVSVRRFDFESTDVSPYNWSSKGQQTVLIQLEEPCVKQGGMCQLIEDCAAANIVSMRGVLCPKQVAFGVECCYL